MLSLHKVLSVLTTVEDRVLRSFELYDASFPRYGLGNVSVNNGKSHGEFKGISSRRALLTSCRCMPCNWCSSPVSHSPKWPAFRSPTLASYQFVSAIEMRRRSKKSRFCPLSPKWLNLFFIRYLWAELFHTSFGHVHKANEYLVNIK